MKKIALILGLGLSLNAGAVPNNDVLDQLNSEIVSVLGPIQNQLTIAQLAFDTVETDSERALKVGLKAFYHKVGLYNTFEFKINNLSYDYGDGSKPMTVFKGLVGLNFTKLLPQDQINEIVPNAAQTLENIANNYYGRDYGDAASIKGVVTSTTKDADGNYTSLTGLISAKIDLSKLPNEEMSEYIMATEAVLYVTINVRAGISVDGYVLSNPLYKGFQYEEEGLKETLDKLLAHDDETFAQIKRFVESIDMIASYVVNNKNSLKYSDHKIQWAEKTSNK